VLDVLEVADHLGTIRLRPEGSDDQVTLGLAAAAKIRALPGRADPALFHRVPERARLAAAAG
jgi:hypothetical protein